MKRVMVNYVVLAILTLSATLISCENSKDEYDENDIFESEELGFSQKILDGYVIQVIDFDSKGNAWIGTLNQGLILYNTKETVVFNSDNSTIPEDFMIWDIVVDKNDNVWIAGDGLMKYDGNKFTLYNSKNTAMPEDAVGSINVDSKNNLWFTSCRFRQGGLVKYNGTEWTVYTPDNSSLPDNLINDIAIDQSDNVWLTVNDHLVKFSNDSWKIYNKDDLGLTNYVFAGIQFNNKNLLFGITDNSFNNLAIQPPCELYYFDGKNASLLSNINNITSIPGNTKLTIDHNDNVWCYGGIGGKNIGVWSNKNHKLSIINSSEFNGLSVWVIKEDANHKIWFGTEDGIFIR